MPEIGASGLLGVAIETTPGTYKVPDKYIPINSESLKYNINPIERRPIRQTAGLVDIIPGNATVEGDVEYDVTTDALIYFLLATRCSYVKTGAGPYVYTLTPTSVAVPTKTLSITIKRGDEIFGYTGCVVGSFSLTIGDDGKLVAKMTVLGRNEEEVTDTLTVVWPTAPLFYAGMYVLSIPTGTQVYDTDSFEFSSEDNGKSNARIQDNPGSAFINFGESNGMLKVSRDFENRTEYDAYKAGTGKSITLLATSNATNIISILLPVGKMRTYEINLGGQGDLVRATIEYAGIVDSTGKHYQVVVTTGENIT